MSTPYPILACIDAGNTRTHVAAVRGEETLAFDHGPTPELLGSAANLSSILASWRTRGIVPQGASFCSVVPALDPVIRKSLGEILPETEIFQITHNSNLGFPISYPYPEEIGQDRLANAVGAHKLYGTPVVVIDMGTAVTLEVISARRGFAGGVIAPGVELMLRSLHERTALLPDLAPESPGADWERGIGHSTVEAMQIGCATGFRGLVQALLEAALRELAELGESTPRIVATGGAAPRVTGKLTLPVISIPHLTFLGLAEAWRLK